MIPAGSLVTVIWEGEGTEFLPTAPPPTFFWCTVWVRGEWDELEFVPSEAVGSERGRRRLDLNTPVCFPVLELTGCVIWIKGLDLSGL